MGQHNYPNRAFMINLFEQKSDIIRFLTDEMKEEIRKNNNGKDISDELIYNFLDNMYLVDGEKNINVIINGKEISATLFQFNEEDEGDDIEEGTLFLIIDENELYTKIETPLLKYLKDSNIKVEEKNWVNFC